MAGVSLSELEARKRALVMEAEICRETIKSDVQNLRLCAIGFKHKLDHFRSFAPWLALGAPLLGFLFGKRAKSPRPSRLKGGIAAALLGLRLYRQYGPVVRSLVAQFAAKKRHSAKARTTAANI